MAKTFPKIQLKSKPKRLPTAHQKWLKTARAELLKEQVCTFRAGGLTRQPLLKLGEQAKILGARWRAHKEVTSPPKPAAAAAVAAQ